MTGGSVTGGAVTGGAVTGGAVTGGSVTGGSGARERSSMGRAAGTDVPDQVRHDRDVQDQEHDAPEADVVHEAQISNGISPAVVTTTSHSPQVCPREIAQPSTLLNTASASSA